MKVCQLTLLVVALFVGALLGGSQALAADGLPSDATLAAMGLSDLRVMTDREGLAVRGLGFNGANAYGQSFAVVSTMFGSAGSFNGYNVSGKYKASGENYSFAGVEIKKYGGGDHGGGYGNSSYGNNSYGNKSKGSKGGGHGGKPKSIRINAFAGGSSTGHR